MNRVIQSTSGKEGAEEEEATYRDEIPSEGKPEPEQQQQPLKKQKIKTHITAKDYENMTHLLAHHLKVAESKAETSGESSFVGMVWEDLVAQYVEQVSNS